MAAVLPEHRVQRPRSPYDDRGSNSWPTRIVRLIANGIDAPDEDGHTALHWAAQKGDLRAVKTLVDARANVEARVQFSGSTPLHLAAAAGHADLVPLLITPTTLDAVDSNNQTPLQLAVQQRQVEAVAALAAGGAALGSVPFLLSTLKSAIQSLQKEGSPELAIVLLQDMLADTSLAGVVEQAVRWQDGWHKTALHYAASAGCHKLVVLLVQAGADRDGVDRWGATPLWCAAAEAGHAHLVPFLATPGNINLKAGLGLQHSALFLAARNEPPKLVAALLAAGAEPNTRDSIGHSALTIAALDGHMEVVATLLTALAADCKQPLQPPPHQQQQAGVIPLVVEAIARLASCSNRLQDCSRLLEAVLDVLGPGVGGQLCCEVMKWQPQDQGSSDAETTAEHQVLPASSRCLWLEGALLLGWMRAISRLHAARQPLVARLQRLVLGVEAAQQQELKVLEQQLMQVLEQQLMQLLRDAAAAAAAHGKSCTAGLLFASNALSQQCNQDSAVAGTAAASPGMSNSAAAGAGGHGSYGVAVRCLKKAVALERGWGSVKSDGRSCSIRPQELSSSLLAAWVGARRQLQHLPQEVATTVVAAVEAAQQQAAQDAEEEDQLLCCLLGSSWAAQEAPPQKQLLQQHVGMPVRQQQQQPARQLLGAAAGTRRRQMSAGRAAAGGRSPTLRGGRTPGWDALDLALLVTAVLLWALLAVLLLVVLNLVEQVRAIG